MKYDTLREYREYLARSLRLRPETARTYTNRLEGLLKGQSLTHTVEKLDMEKILHNLSEIKYKNHFSQSKNALLYFLKFQNNTLSEEQENRIQEMELNTRKKYRKKKQIDFQKIDRSIKHIRNKKLKLCFQVLLDTGLRVSELSQITYNDCTITDDEIHLIFTCKGGKQEKEIIPEGNKLYKDLKDRMNECQNKNDTLFYSAVYLHKKAGESGFTCHDLRRICAKLEYKKTKSKEAVRKKLRHTQMKTTNLYLRSKIKGV